MSWQATTWVLEFSQSRLGSRLVLLSIASHANRLGEQSWPSIACIAQEAHISERSVQYAIRELEELGELDVDMSAGPSGTNRYSLPKVRAWVQSLHPGVQSTTLGGATHCTPGVQPIAPEPSLKGQKITVHDVHQSSIDEEEPTESISLKSCAELYRSLRKMFNRKFGQPLGPSNLRGNPGERFVELYGRHREKLADGFELWMGQLEENRSFRKGLRNPIFLFLKDADECVADVGMEGPEKPDEDEEGYLKRIGRIERPKGDW